MSLKDISINMKLEDAYKIYNEFGIGLIIKAGKIKGMNKN